MLSNDQINYTESIKQFLENAMKKFRLEDFSWIRQYTDGNEWAMAEDALCFISTVVSILKPKNILEFGSGLSTYVAAQTAQKSNSKCFISSIDHDPFFGNQAAIKYLEKIKKFDNCQLSMQIAPLVLREFGGEFLPCYYIDKERLATTLPIDLGIIDGLPNSLGGREGTIYQMLEFSKPGTVILLDDANRKEERVAISHWKQNLGEAIEIIELQEFIRGMIAVIIRKPIGNSELLNHRLELLVKEIRTVIPLESKLIIVGDDWWCNEISNNYNVIPYYIGSHDEYVGPPKDDFQAIQEFDRMRGEGAKFIVISSSAFWWFDYYKEWNQYLQKHFSSILENDRFVIFKLGN